MRDDRLPEIRPVVQLQKVGRRYAAGGGFIQVLQNVTLSINPGEVVAVVGPSGSGKSTLLNVAGLIDKPDTGIVIFADVISGDATVDSQTSQASLAALRRAGVGFVFQHFHLMSSLTVLRNAALPALLNRLDSPFDRARDLLHRVGLSHRLEHFPDQLSGGEMQRCAIARALVHSPRLILADEPTGSLDARSGGVVLDLLREASAELTGSALIIATHSAEAAKRAGRIIELATITDLEASSIVDGVISRTPA